MSENFITRLYKNQNLLDIAIQIEDFMENLDIYVFANWIDGEIVDGPNIERYWVEMTMLYDINKMPDPEGGARMIKHGAEVRYKKAFRKEEVVPVRDVSQVHSGPSNKPQFETKEIWLVTVRIPRRFIEELDDDDLELYDQLMDIEDVSDARDDNIENDAALGTNDGEDEVDEDV